MGARTWRSAPDEIVNEGVDGDLVGDAVVGDVVGDDVVGEFVGVLVGDDVVGDVVGDDVVGESVGADVGDDVVGVGAAAVLINLMLLKNQKSGNRQAYATGDLGDTPTGQPMDPEGHFCPKKNGHKH